MEKCSETQHIYIGMLLNKFAQALHRIFMCLWLSYIKGNLMLHILPVIDHRIIHVHRIPHNVCQKAYCIVMERYALYNNLTGLLLIMPFVS